MLQSSCSDHREAGERANVVELVGLFYEDFDTDSEGETVILVCLLMKLVGDC